MDIRRKNTMDLIANLISGEYVLAGIDRKYESYGSGDINVHIKVRTLLGARRHNYSVFDPSIERVIFNPPATIVFWEDGTKTVVKCGEHDIFDPEKGLAMAIAKKALGNEGNYYNEIKKWLPKQKCNGYFDPFAGIVSKAIDQLGGIAGKLEHKLLGND